MIEVKTRGMRPSLLGIFVVLLCFSVAPAAFAQGPDVIVGDIPNTNSYGSSGGIYAYSVATTSCNVGTANLSWVASTPGHPVIAQDMWRLKDGRFTQIGNSWLKHGFCALQNVGLCAGCGGGGGCLSFLTPGCADPYGASLNGNQGNLGPRSLINATTGVFPYPYSAPPVTNATISRRLQVNGADLNAAQNVGALYFVSAQYVAADDANFGNQANNASYRRVNVSQNSNFSLSNAGSTQQMQPPIQAWQDFQATVTLVDVMADGLFIVGYDVTDNGNGTWSYEYAVYNMYSDRSGGSFSVPLPSGVTLTDVGFHGNAWHSGEPYATDDWTATITPGSDITWSTDDFATNPNAHALRWSKMFNFYFTADAPPETNTGTLGLFKPGAGADSHTFDISAPSGNFIPAPGDLACTQMMPTLPTAVLTWTNGAAYDSVLVERDGVTIATLGGTATSYTDSSATFGAHDYSVQGAVGVDLTAAVPCALATSPMPVTGVGCTQTDPNFTDFTVNWTNGMSYDSVRVYVDASLAETLGGAATSTVIDGQAIGIRDVEVVGVVDGTESAPTGCVIDIQPPPPLGFTMSLGTGSGAYDAGSGVGSASITMDVVEEAGNLGFPNPVQGLSASVTYDAALLQATSIDASAALSSVSFFNTELVAGGYTVGVVVDFNNVATLDLSSAVEIATVNFDTNPTGLAGNGTGATAAVQFTDGLGSGIPVENLVVADFDPVTPTLVAGSVTLTPGASTGFARGDANNDGLINIADGISILGYLFTQGPATCLDALDANDDGSNNIADGIYVLGFLFSNGAEPPAPFGSCGVDPTADALECDSYTGGC